MRSSVAASLVFAMGVGTTSTGCSTVYAPRPTGHVALVMEGGSLKYAKNGQTESLGFFGGGLVDAVTGNAAAEDEARDYRNLNIAGFTTTIAGGVSAGAGAVLLIDGAARSNGDDTLASAGLGLLLGGLVAEVVGSILVASAQPHFLDALNIYNDGVDAARFVPPPPGYGPYAYPPPGGVPRGFPPPAAPAAPAAPAPHP